jgi:hypothetical protein
MSIVAVGIDLAKNVFAVHGIDETGTVVLSVGADAKLSSCADPIFARAECQLV